MPAAMSSGSRWSPRQVSNPKSEVADPAPLHSPLLIHLDVNKTVIPSDSMQLTGIEDGIRESVADLFWGTLTSTDQRLEWEWMRCKPSSTRPYRLQDSSGSDKVLATYGEFCKKVVKKKDEMKAALRSFHLVSGQPVKEEMERLVKSTMRKLLLRQDICNSKEAEAVGITGNTLNMFPTLFHLAAALQRAGRPFALLFRSFGADHVRVQQEWNAFCELRHPVFSHLIEDIGPMDGSVPSIPDRRLHGIHTLYRDAEGPMLILDTFTNGPQHASWDSWAKGAPKPAGDTRGGREFVKSELKASTADGYSGVRDFMESHLRTQSTGAIKDDWAWWVYNGERADAGKLLTAFEGSSPAQQLFFDDNIGHDDARIVDCRGVDGVAIPTSVSLRRFCQKVNPVEAVLDKNYFLRKLLSMPYQSPCGPPRPPNTRPPSTRPQRPSSTRAGWSRVSQGGTCTKRPRIRSRSVTSQEVDDGVQQRPLALGLA